MRLRDNKIAVFLINLLVWVIFIIPVLLRKLEKSEQQSDSKNILIIELWGLGDLVMMSSILKRLKNGSSVKITLLCKSHVKSIFKNDDAIDEFIEFDFPWIKFRGKYWIWKWDWKGIVVLIKHLKSKKFDLVLDARGDLRNNILSFLSGAKRRVGYDWTGGSYLLTDPVHFVYRHRHRTDAWVELLNHLDIKEFSPKSYINVLDDEKKWAEDFLREHGIGREDRIVGIHPGARIATRCWSLKRFGEIGDYAVDTYNTKVIVFIDPQGYGEDIGMEEDHIFARVNLRQLIVLLKSLDLFICNDGGAMHMATAVDTPLIAILGPTSPIWFSPQGKSTVVIKEDVECRPCFDYCKYKKPFCIEAISTDEVKKEIDRKMVNICN